jgi:hypothetical protein
LRGSAWAWLRLDTGLGVRFWTYPGCFFNNP